MLHEIDILEAYRIADLSAAAREVRDRALAALRETGLGEIRPARGEHDAAGTLGFDAMPADEPAHLRLREAIDGLPIDISRKLWAVMRTESGHYARDEWEQALAAAAAISDANIVGDLAEEVAGF
jgi:hypothetical protein